MPFMSDQPNMVLDVERNPLRNAYGGPSVPGQARELHILFSPKPWSFRFLLYTTLKLFGIENFGSFSYLSNFSFSHNALDSVGKKQLKGEVSFTWQ